MFMQTMMRNPGALKMGWHWLLTVSVNAGYGAWKRSKEK